jgi:hypothetical protein
MITSICTDGLVLHKFHTNLLSKGHMPVEVHGLAIQQ